MTNERIRTHVERLLSEADDALVNLDWDQVKVKAEAVLRLEPNNPDAVALLRAVNRGSGPIANVPQSHATGASPTPPQPTSFGKGRYQVRRFLGEGGKKKVYLAHDSLL